MFRRYALGGALSSSSGRERMRTAACVLLAVLLCAPLQGYLWGYSVDDAWIVSRVAARGLSGGGFSFNPGQATDAVTPLGYAQLVAMVSHLFSTEPALAARVLGVAAMQLAVGLAAYSAYSQGPQLLGAGGGHRLRRLTVLVVALGTCPSVAAWAGAGLETSVVAFAVTLGCAFFERQMEGGAGRLSLGSWLGALLLGCALAWRPELVGYVAVSSLLLVRGLMPRAPRVLAGLLGLTLVPTLLVATFRFCLFGRLLPLSLAAKEPSLSLGLRYVLGSALLCGPLLLLWGSALARLLGRRQGEGRTVGGSHWLWAFAAHGLCLVFAGGDWMPLYRLWVPVLPWAGVVAAKLVVLPGETFWRLRFALPAFLAVSSSALLLAQHGVSARCVVSRRAAMVATLRPHLAKRGAVATVDIGWVGAATAERVLDLAGVTDPRVAALPGGHTSRLITPGFFSARNVEAWVIRSPDRAFVPGEPLGSVRATYVVDARLLSRADDLGMRGVAVVPIPGTSGQYVVAAREP